MITTEKLNQLAEEVRRESRRERGGPRTVADAAKVSE